MQSAQNVSRIEAMRRFCAEKTNCCLDLRFVSNRDDFPFLHPGRNLKPHTSPDPRIQQSLRDWRTPTHPISIDISLVDSNDAIFRFHASFVAHGYCGSETHFVFGFRWWRNHFGRLQALVQISDAHIEFLEKLEFRRIVGSNHPWPLNISQLFQFLFEPLRAISSDVVLHARWQRRHGPLQNGLRTIIVACESLAHGSNEMVTTNSLSPSCA